MEFNLNTKIDEDIPIFVEKCDEDAASFIERSFYEMKQKEKLSKHGCTMSEDIKSYIENIIRTHINSKTKRENYYEYELMKSYKERIVFLEGEIKLKNKLINSLLESNSAEVSHVVNKNKTDRIVNVTDQNQTIDLSFSPDIVDTETPNTSIAEKETSWKENKISFEKQLTEVRKRNHDNYLKTKNNDEKLQSVKEKTNVLLIGDSMLNGINEVHLTNEKINTKIKYLSGARVNDINKRLDEFLIEKPDIVMLHVGTNDAPHMASNNLVDVLVTLKNKVQNLLPDTKVIMSTMINRIDDGKANLTITKVNNRLKELDIALLDNSNITYRNLGKKGLHLSKQGKKIYENNVLNKVKQLL